MSRPQLNIRMDRDTLARLDRLARIQDRKRSNMARYLLQRVLAGKSLDDLVALATQQEDQPE